MHKRLGFGSFVEYLGMVFGCTPREARDRLAVVTPDTEGAWLEAVRDKGMRAVENQVCPYVEEFATEERLKMACVRTRGRSVIS